ncbi:MAG: acyl-CoA dehydrogenase family protein, partial [Nocardioides sp.]
MTVWHRHNLDPVHTVAPTSGPYDTPERVALRERVRAFAMDEVLPVANQLDRLHEDIPDHLLERMGELGLFGVLVPEDEGGLGLGVYEYCLVSEELARAWMSVASIIARGNGTGCDAPDADERLRLRRLSATGRRIGAIAFSEPDAGSDLASVSCRAERDGDEWVITGTKRWVGHALSADFIHLLARTRPPREDHGPSDGLELFLVEKVRGKFPDGVTGTPIDKIGYFGLTTWQLELDGLRLPADALQDTGEEEGQGFKHSLGWLNVARVQTAARAVGLARGALEDAVAYSRRRVQFGKPIGDQQAIRHLLADMAADVAAARQLYEYAA